MERPKSFNDIIGHDWLVSYLQEHLERGTLPHFLILEGPEGLGKTSIADLLALNLVYGVLDSSEKTKAYETVVKKKVSNDFIKKFELSVEGGKDVAKEVRSEMHATFNLNKKKVIICDECHNLSEAAQDVFLSDTEYIDDKVYMIMLTTEVSKLKPTLRSRAVTLTLHPLKHSDMIKVLKREVVARKLSIQNEDITLSLIAEWAECKPRTGLNILNAFSQGSAVNSNVVRELIGYMDIKDLAPLLGSLAGSMTFGLSYISEMKVDNSLISLVVEAVKVKNGESSYKLKQVDITYLRDTLAQVSVDQLVSFLYGLTKHQRLTRTDVINAYINAHVNRNDLYKSSTKEMLDVEKSQKAQVIVNTQVTAQVTAPTLEDIMLDSQVIE